MGVNLYKIRGVLEFIRRQGKLPTDAYGRVLSAREMLGWFGLKDCLTPEELSYIERELIGTGTCSDRTNNNRASLPFQTSETQNIVNLHFSQKVLVA